MYKSPLEVIHDEAVYKTLKDEENNMMLAIQQKIGYKVDKDELIKALRYDRNQYEKGYNDAVANLQKTGKGRWIKYGVPRCGEQHYQCTSCGYYINFGQWGEVYTKEFKYCPCCGEKMEVE